MSTSSPPQPNKKQSSTVVSGCSLIFALLHCLRNKKRTTPSFDSDSNPPHPFSYTLLRRATNSFSTLLGHGGFGPVYSGSLPSSGKPIAVKLMDSTSSQGEHEFHNELFFASRLRSNLLVPAIGFSSDHKRRRFLLVYELMHNGNLHDALLRRKLPELMLWKTRFSIILEIAKGIQYLHSCDPPIIHGDIKPSNILLDNYFFAKIADFGLARFKTLPNFEIRKDHELESDGMETESFNTSFDEYEKESAGVVVVGGVKKSGSVKDYVMDWIGKEVKNDELGGCGSGTGSRRGVNSKSKKKLEWWESMDNVGKADMKKEKRRSVREWWKEEHSQEVEKKKKKKKMGGKNSDNWWENERDYDVKKRNSKNRSKKERGSVDSWLSGELRRVGCNNYDSCNNSGEIPKSGGISNSTSPSMRGTVFYVAPENGYSGDVTEKCDVYSFGVLLLVIISGRRPLEVNGDGFTHVLEFKRANLVSWARHCARKGKLLELVDPSVELLLDDDKEKALVCIKIALLCLVKSANRRPSMKDVVGMLSGELEVPQLPHEYSQSPFQFKNLKQGL
ncbi:receptor-like serine/threonine-protein kinase At4g25390 [Cicer arietinum]|uniref:Receptor-like serine/threonine-protein kinase At4g25390 n=1 Tax=Cicer arietinum TaxID=3827 RepID=A0A1S2XYT8_CICAR|nr:receptor-like serine/threonine-protein kinase At4g25390 [Cicer arietinum]